STARSDRDGKDRQYDQPEESVADVRLPQGTPPRNAGLLPLLSVHDARRGAHEDDERGDEDRPHQRPDDHESLAPAEVHRRVLGQLREEHGTHAASGYDDPERHAAASVEESADGDREWKRRR